MSHLPPNAPNDGGLGKTIHILSLSAARSGRLAKLAPKARALAESGLAPLRVLPTACTKGCCHCCYRLVDATLPEAVAIAEHVATNFKPEELTSLQQRFDGYEEAIARYFRRETSGFGEACPFLVDQACSIYEQRPLGCRGLASPDASLCAAWLKDGGDPPFYEACEAVSTDISKGIVAGLLEGGAPSGMFELAGAVQTLIELGESACWRENFSAPIEKFLTKTPRSDGKFDSSPPFTRLRKIPRFSDFWEGILAGDIETSSYLLTKFQDSTLTTIANLALPSFYESQDQLEEAWAKLHGYVEDFENARLDPRSAFDRLPTLYTFFWPYTGKDIRPLVQRVMRKVNDEIVAPCFPKLTEPLTGPRKPGRFRLGYLSTNLTNSNGSRWAAGWLAHHSPEIETFAFNLHPVEDEYTSYWRRLADHYFHFPTHPHLIAEHIRSLDLDALIITDVGINAFDHQLSCLRLARRQFTAWGHPVTTGSPAIDGYLSSAMMEPVGAQAHYSEELFLLPGSGLCYPRIVHQPADVDPTAFGLPSTGFYFEAQMASKRLPKHDDLYRRISEASGKPIAFVEPIHEFSRELLTARLAKAGINAVVVPRLDVRKYLGLMAKADAVLDGPAWNGGNSTIDALTLGKPVVSMAGEFMRGRHCLAFHRIAGVPGLIASDEDDYVALALDKERQAKAMESLDAAALYDDLAPVAALEGLLLEGFGDWTPYQRSDLDTAVSSVPPLRSFSGRGVVTSAGGRLLPSAYVMIRSLRHSGCELPIQLWHLGPDEMPPSLVPVFAKYGVECVDSFKVLEQRPFKKLGGWQNKIFSIIGSPFEEVLFLDADNFVVANPDFLFDLPEYQESGSIFWPDFLSEGLESWAIKRFAWDFLGLEPRNGAELESGQIVVNKSKCWAALNVARHMNERSDFFYEQCTYGDKDTFTLAWAVLNEPMYVIPHRPAMMKDRIRMQHAPDGSTLFQHARKWELPVHENRFNREYLLEDEALEWLADLAALR